MSSGNRSAKTARLTEFLDTFFGDMEVGELMVNGWLLVKWWPTPDRPRIEIYRYPPTNPHGRLKNGK